MSDVQLLTRRIERAERRVRLLSAAAVVLATAFLAAAVQPPAEVLRARGIVLVDAAGRERIVLGAPLAEVSGDARLAAASGIVVLDSAGRPMVALGIDNPLIGTEGKTAERVGRSAGLTFYDLRTGQERGGMGTLEDGRANVCLDYASALKEAACMTVAGGDQYAAVLLNGTPREKTFDRVTMFVGADGSGSIKVFGSEVNPGGVMIRSGRGSPSITVYDSSGTVLGDVVGNVSRSSP
jgi:hypothetical protein